MGIIKGVLSEELENSSRLKRAYEEKILKIPGGSIVKKLIRGNAYYYIAFREGRKVRFVYKGKALSSEFREELKKSKDLKAKYRGQIHRINARIRYLRRVLHGKEDV